MTTYNKKAFLLPESAESMAACHATIRPDGQYRFRIHDCIDAIRLHGNLTDPVQVTEAIEKLRTLARATEDFAAFIYENYTKL